jgi:hypothetical protein
MSWKGIVAQQFSPAEFRDYVAGLAFDEWVPDLFIVHHTAEPSLANRPNGLSLRNIRGLESYYRDEKGWNSGPHLFVDDHGIWVFTPLTVKGVHAVSFHSRGIGMEMLGNYDVEDFNSGRGAAVRDNAVAACAIVCAKLGIGPEGILGHRDDPQTAKTCPGNGVDLDAFIARVQGYAV